MTHAALKDLLDKYDHIRDHVGGCSDGGCVVKRPVGMHTNGGCKCSTDKHKARSMMWAGQKLRDELAAALSAPQGEVVAIQGAVFYENGVSLIREGTEDDWVRTKKAERIYRVTAPPPQQADNEADDLLKELGLDASRFRSEGGWLNFGKIKAALKYPDDYSGYYLHPTPSPGPQGGDEAEIRWVIGSTVFGRPTGADALAYADANWCEGSATDCRIPKLDKIRAVFATPPQPEAQVSDAMAEVLDLMPRAVELAERLCAPGPKASHVSASETHEIRDWVLAAAAALTTSGRDG